MVGTLTTITSLKLWLTAPEPGQECSFGQREGLKTKDSQTKTHELRGGREKVTDIRCR